MAFRKGENPNHPKKGAAIKVEPIRDLAAIAWIKEDLLAKRQYRNYCLFTLGINTAWRANELLSIKVGQVRGLGVGEKLELKQSKTGQYRSTPINHAAWEAIQLWLDHYPHTLRDHAPLFPSHQYSCTLGVPALCNLVKRWCALAGLHGQYGSHSLRKTWGFQQRTAFNAPLTLLMKAFGHASEYQTLRYIGIQEGEVDQLYAMEL